MRPLSKRECREAQIAYSLVALGTLGWWVLVFANPGTQPYFFGDFSSQSLVNLFLVPDVVSALLGSVATIIALSKGYKWVGFAAAVTFGAQGYAALLTVGIAIHSPQSYPGACLMLLSSGVLAALALRFSGIEILWGPFRFQQAQRDRQSYCLQSLLQSAGMWLVFLGLLPATIAAIEAQLGFSASWIEAGWILPVAIFLFVAAGTVGLVSGNTMAKLGEGTPLPSSCTNKLVVSSPYGYIRNPMATTGITQGVAVGMAIGSPLCIAVALLGGIWWEILVRPVEEEFLRSQFGPAYDAYRAAVPCWWIRLSPYCQSMSD